MLSSTDSPRKIDESWGRYMSPKFDLLCIGKCVMSFSPSIIVPESAFIIPVSMENSVVFPAPFGPSMPVISFWPNDTSTPFSIVSSPNDLKILYAEKSNVYILSVEASSVNCTSDINKKKHFIESFVKR